MPRDYHFGETSHRARRQHRCDFCFNYIERGKRYSRRIWVTDRRYFIVLREHERPRCPENDADREYNLQVAAREALGEPIHIVAKQQQVAKVLVNGDVVFESETVFESVIGEMPKPPLYDSDDDPDIPF